MRAAGAGAFGGERVRAEPADRLYRHDMRRPL